MNERRILHAHFHMPYGAHPDLYEQLLLLAEGITPRVQAIPPDAAHLDISGALRYWDRTPEQLAALLRLRTMALHGVQTTCAIAPNRNRRVPGFLAPPGDEPEGHCGRTPRLARPVLRHHAVLQPAAHAAEAGKRGEFLADGAYQPSRVSCLAVGFFAQALEPVSRWRAAWEAYPSTGAAHAGRMRGNRDRRRNRNRRRLIAERRRGLRRPARPANEARAVSWVTLLAAAPGIAALVALAATFSQVRLAEQGQITTRFNDATTNLGSNKEPVAFGGIYALDRIMTDSPKDQPRVISVLSAYVRNKRSVPEEGKFSPLSGRVPEAPREVTAATRVLASRPSGEDGRGQVDLAYADLHGLRLSSYNVDETQQETTPGRRVLPPPRLKFGPVNLGFADLRFANIVHTDLDTSFLWKANLTCSNFLDVSIHRTNLEFARLDSIQWKDVRMRLADLTSAHLTGAVLEKVDLSGTDLIDADLRGAQLKNVNLTGVELPPGAFLAGKPMKKADGSDLRVRNANLTSAQLQGAVLQDVDLSGANLINADLRGAQLTNVNLTGAIVYGARFDGASMTGVIGLPAASNGVAPPVGTDELPAEVNCDKPVNLT
ncbi:pentapeptide repeat-containing protein [Streptomyces sp. NPDC048269]|uniref:pentapeptide repeat-containing protein n=1 Tax=Streptomyces sp. NPDC048269 TaxID=3155753 RepID=UPI003429C754